MLMNLFENWAVSQIEQLDRSHCVPIYCNESAIDLVYRIMFSREIMLHALGNYGIQSIEFNTITISILYAPVSLASCLISISVSFF